MQDTARRCQENWISEWSGVSGVQSVLHLTGSNEPPCPGKRLLSQVSSLTGLPQTLALLLLVLSTSGQLLDDEARARFDAILKDFGFSEISRANVRQETPDKLEVCDGTTVSR